MVSPGVLRQSGGIAALAILLQLNSPALSEEYLSPDSRIIAIVAAAGLQDCEARVEIRRLTGELVSNENYVSEDHEHGSCVNKAAWTPDASFFVFSLENSGGHQPWHTPVRLWSRAHLKFIQLEDYLKDPITSPDFVVRPPEEVEIETTKIPLDRNSAVRQWIDLGSILHE